ncbi:carbon starvation protein [Gammaproteobacteria bacterium]
MNILFIIMATVIIFFIAYHSYGKFLAEKVFQLDDDRTAPSVLLHDGIDYDPIDAKYLLGQHFSAIAAAGPITGPILAGIMFGWVPALIWIVIGSIFVGGVHDMGSLIASVRHKARSITEVVRENVSNRAWIIFMIFIWITLVYIIVAFTDITTASFVGTVTLENGQKVGGGAIATSSMLYLILPVIMGLLLKHTRLSLNWATAIFLPLIGMAIWVGPYIPFNLTDILGSDTAFAQKIWNVIILGYCLIAALVPVWALLQPRGHLGGYFLYISLIVAIIGIISGGFQVRYPAFTKFDGDTSDFLFPMFPILFITVACGACSGFHSLVSSGTTSKQIKKESDATFIGYGAMLLEGVVAIVALATVMILSREDTLIGKAPNFIYASGIGRFLELIGIPAALGISFGLMAFTTFVYDTLDICTRLGRYIIEELTGWRNYWGRIFATTITAVVPLFFVTMTVLDAKGNPMPAWKAFWGTFGASNQLLAGLALIGVTVWVFKTIKGGKVWIVPLIPAVLMFGLSNWAILSMIQDAWFKDGSLALTAAPVPWVCLMLVVLSIMLVFETIYALGKKSICD